jgi:hypothetical protein
MYIVLDVFSGAEYAYICSTETGENLCFDTEEEAKAYGSENCQEPIVVKINN